MQWIPAPLDSRKQGILKAVVTDYVRTAEPVGSHMLVERYAFGVKSATIRSELAELSELGYLQQPHTSAGRIPSDLGYRFYVDRLMEAARLQESLAERARQKLQARRSEVDLILEQTCRILSDLAQYASVATRPALKESAVRHVSVGTVGAGKLLAVVVLDNGAVLHELIDTEKRQKPLDPVVATNFLTDALAGRTVQSLDSDEPEPMRQAPAGAGEVLGKVLDFIKRELAIQDESDVHFEGANYIMQQPEFKDFDRLEAVLSMLEERNALYRLLSSVYLGPEVTVLIGSENPVEQMHDCSFVGTTYRIGNRIAGTIGILGPTRMNYRRAVSAVEFMAGNLTALLTQLSS